MRHKGTIFSAFVIFVLLAASLAALIPSGETADPVTDTLGAEAPNFDGYTPITNIQELSDIRNNLSGKYYLANDIIFGAGSGSNFEPIGFSYSESFTGKFDGNGYIIEGLRTAVNTPGTITYSGLFGFVGSGGTIRNLGVVNGSSSATSSSDAYAGGIVGYSASASIINCYNTGTVSASSSSNNAYAGGIVGYTSYANSSFTNCYNTGTVSASAPGSVRNAYAGGIVGGMLSSLSITNCYNTGTVSASSSYHTYAGGIAGYASSSSSSITGCYNTGNVTISSSSSSYAYAGGIVGYSSSFGLIANCYNTGNVTISTSSSSSAYAGGIVAYMSSSSSYSSALITNCYNTGNLSASSGPRGGIVGYTFSMVSITNCYSLQQMRGSGYGSPIVDGDDTYNRSTSDPDQRSSTSKTLAQMTPSFSAAAANNSIYFTGTTNNIAGWNFDTVWAIDESSVPINGGLPILRAFLITASVIENPEDLTVLGGETVSFSAAVSIYPDTPAFIYRWQVSADNGSTWEDIPGVHGLTYTIPVANLSLSGNLYRFAVTVPGYNDVTIESSPAELTVMPSFTVSGQVTFEGAGLAGAEITYKIDNDIPQTMAADTIGNYSMIVQTGRTLTIMNVECFGYEASESMPSPFTDDSTANFTMIEKYFTVSGNVTVGGAGLAGAEIIYRINNDPYLTTATDTSGNFSMTAQVGKTITVLEIRLTGYQLSGSMPSPFTDDSTADFTMVEKYFTVYGQITSDGKGTANMRILYIINSGPTQRAVTDSSGNYSITAQVGKTITIVKFEIDGYKVQGPPPSSYTTDSRADFVWTPEKGINIGIVPLLVIVGAIIGGIAGAAIYFITKKKR